MKALPIISIIIAGVVAITVSSSLEKDSMGWVVPALAVSIILIAVYLLGTKDK